MEVYFMQNSRKSFQIVFGTGNQTVEEEVFNQVDTLVIIRSIHDSPG